MCNLLNYIDNNDLFFYISEGGLLQLKYKGKDLGRVAIIRLFPFQFKEEFLVVRCENYSRRDSDNELGILRNLEGFTNEQINIIRKELQKRYFIPEILKVYDVKEEFGNTMWQVETTAGRRDFTVSDMGTNIRKLDNNKVMLTDVYGNRYFINDLGGLNDNVLKIIEIWI